MQARCLRSEKGLVERPGAHDLVEPLPERTSLFGKDNVCGLPIGNLTSQFWANVYLNELDQFVKRTLKCRHYIRYVDDMVVLSEDRGQLLLWRDAISEFLLTGLRLALRADGQEPMLVRRGVEFVGWKTSRNYRVPRRRTAFHPKGTPNPGAGRGLAPALRPFAPCGAQSSTCIVVESEGAGVPEISRFFGVVIRMFYDDHQPPHLHAHYGEDSALIVIQPISVIETSLPTRALSMVLEWTALHQQELLENWERLHSSRPPKKVAPLT